MKQFSGLMLAIAACAAAASHSSAAVLTIDNFEEYTSGQSIASSASSTPWRRFGLITDNFYATKGAAQDGVLGGQIPYSITSGTGQAVVQKNLVTATNLTAYASATVLMESLTAVGGVVSRTDVQLDITDGNSTYASTVPIPLTGVSTSTTFLIDTADMTDINDNSTAETLATVLTNANSIGFRMTSPTATAALPDGETVAFDDFTLSTPAVALPEPATASLALLGMTAVGGLRRRSR